MLVLPNEFVEEIVSFLQKMSISPDKNEILQMIEMIKVKSKKMGMSKLDNEIVDQRLAGKNIKRIGDYVGYKDLLEMECLIHVGYRWKTTPCSLLSKKSGCPKCSNQENCTNNSIDEKLQRLNKNIKRIGDYAGIRGSIEFECLKDGYRWMGDSYNVSNGKSGCPKCSNRIKLTNDEIDKRLLDEKRNIKRIGDITFADKDTKLEWNCLLCEHTWQTTTGHILHSKTGCPFCRLKNERKLQKLISEYVSNEFEWHKEVLSVERSFFPDFYFKINNKEIVIEYNGEQHYKPVRFGGCSKERAEEIFIKVTKRDEDFKQFCDENKIVLIEIPYFMPEKEVIDILIQLKQTYF